MPDQVKFYVKENVSQHEYEIHSYVYNLGIVNVPRIIEYDPFTKRMIMDRVGEMNISDFYGEKSKHIDPELFERIRVIIQKLYDHNILYIDITGYNFIETDNELWIIDFEHATYNTTKKNKFVEKFLKGFNGWNPEFI
jgi:tRNA A-37 threonylcarbamoyl transferase component Bud32